MTNKKMIKLQGHGRTGWDLEECATMDDVRAFLQRAHAGDIWVYVATRAYVLPRGMGLRVDKFEEY